MKRKRIMLYLALLCLFCGCGKQKAEKPEAEVIESKTIYNDFIFTLTAEKVSYTEEEAGEEEPFSYTLEMEYTGDERLRLWYGGYSLGSVNVMKGGKPVYERAVPDILYRFELEKGEHITITEWRGWHTEDEESLTTGVYTVEGEIDFQIGEVYEAYEDDEDKPENNDYIHCKLSLPLMIQ